MSLIIRGLGRNKLFDIYRGLSAVQTRRGHWYPHFKPGPYPKTEEEKLAAAKKYNLLPEEYEPYPEDDYRNLGDYPKLPAEPVDLRDPWLVWDNAAFRRGFNEPVNCDFVLLLPEVSSAPGELKQSLKELGYFSIFLLTFLAFWYFASSLETVHPVMEKQYPTPGVTHYTFDLDYDKQ